MYVQGSHFEFQYGRHPGTAVYGLGQKWIPRSWKCWFRNGEHVFMLFKAGLS